MDRALDPRGTSTMQGDAHGLIVVAGPSSALTIPGIVVTQIVKSLAQSKKVVRIEVDLGVDFDAGLHRAPSLAVAHDDAFGDDVTSFVAPANHRQRVHAFRKWIARDASNAIAFAWPGIDNSWISQFVEVARSLGVATTVVCVSPPRSSTTKLTTAANFMLGADLVLVGQETDARLLRTIFGSGGPTVETHHALSLHRRSAPTFEHRITAFLPKDGVETLATLLSAYDAIPEAWIESYRLSIAMRHSGSEAPEMVAQSYHSEFVELVGGDISSKELKELCTTSSALIIADPAVDSRAFSIAVDCGVAVVVLASAQLPVVGRGYVGALLADGNRPVSVHVALTHALRLTDLQFPRPDAWKSLVDRILSMPVVFEVEPSVLEVTSGAV